MSDLTARLREYADLYELGSEITDAYERHARGAGRYAVTEHLPIIRARAALGPQHRPTTEGDHLMGLWHPDRIDGTVAHQIDACPNCEPHRRPRMAVCEYHEGWIAALDWLGDLPDADHIHVQRHPDGTWTAVPMLEVAWGLRTAEELQGTWWVDVDGAR